MNCGTWVSEAFDEYNSFFRDINDALRDVRDSGPRDFNAPRPTVTQCPWPAVLGIPQATGPHMGRMGRVVILTGSADAARRLLEPTPPALGNLPAKAELPRATVSFIDTAALTDRAEPGVKRAARRMARWVYKAADPAAFEKQVDLHVETLLESMKVIRSVACERYVDDGAVVTHRMWELRDVE